MYTIKLNWSFIFYKVNFPKWEEFSQIATFLIRLVVEPKPPSVPNIQHCIRSAFFTTWITNPPALILAISNKKIKYFLRWAVFLWRSRNKYGFVSFICGAFAWIIFNLFSSSCSWLLLPPIHNPSFQRRLTLNRNCSLKWSMTIIDLIDTYTGTACQLIPWSTSPQNVYKSRDLPSSYHTAWRPLHTTARGHLYTQAK